MWGYLSATLLRTAPKTVLNGRTHVLVENLGDEVFTMTADRKLLKLAGVRRGDVLYDGLASSVGAATCPEFGYGFRVYPFAERMLDHINVRVYDRGTAAAIKDIPKLWRGVHPLRGMHDWFARHVRLTFSRDMALQIGGDAVGDAPQRRDEGQRPRLPPRRLAPALSDRGLDRARSAAHWR